MPLEALRRLDVEKSILNTIKDLLGIAADQTNFDDQIIVHINTVFFTLQQLGVGPSPGFFVESAEDNWEDFIPEGVNYNSIKTYMYLKVKLLFDPPLSSGVLEAMERMAVEYEWRLKVEAESN